MLLFKQLNVIAVQIEVQYIDRENMNSFTFYSGLLWRWKSPQMTVTIKEFIKIIIISSHSLITMIL